MHCLPNLKEETAKVGVDLMFLINVAVLQFGFKKRMDCFKISCCFMVGIEPSGV